MGKGLTVTVAVVPVPAQPFAVEEIVKVTRTGAVVKLVKDPLMSPDPLPAIPVTDTVLSLVHE